MDYSTAVHGWWCNSRTFPTRCRYCGDPVFFFECDHGCRVFFNELGAPWPEHRCLDYLIAQYGRDFIAEGMAIMMMTPGVEIGHKIDPAYARNTMQQAEHQRRQNPLPCNPYGDQETITEGIVHEVHPRVNIAKQFGIPCDTPIGAAMLGDLLKGDYGQITLHTGSLGDEESWSFTFLVSHKQLDRRNVRNRDIIRCRLRAHTIPGCTSVWICEELQGAI
jgi:hypothetical protein